MKLVKYIFKRFLPIFFGAMGFFSLVLLLVDLLMNLWKYIQNEAAVTDVLFVMLYYLPKTIWYAIPMGILFASAYTLSQLYATNELTAVFASGVSLFRFTLPLLIFSIFMSIAMFVFEDYIVVDCMLKKNQLQAKLLNEVESQANDNIVVISENGKIIYKARSYNDIQHKLQNVMLVIRDDEKNLLAIINADSLYWNEENKNWRMYNAVQYTQKDDSFVCEAASSDFEEFLTEPYETFQNNTVSVESVNSRTAKVYIQHLKRAGLPYSEELSVYYKKFSFPFIVFLVVFLSVGLSGRSRKNVLLISLALCICAAVLFYVVQMVTMLLAKFGYISPFAGAWTPVFLFIFLSIILLRTSRT
ncbi:MAG: LptF/LptG family permease [Spirochaetia bacterium]|nr:LptF/LptG family permease [Spirochaetia bacterium]